MHNCFVVAVFFFDIDVAGPMQWFFAMKMERCVTKASINAIFYPNQAFFSFIAAFVHEKEGVAVELQLIDLLLDTCVVGSRVFFLDTSPFALCNSVVKARSLCRVEVTQLLTQFELARYMLEIRLRFFF